MTAPSIALTTAGGGISRLRVKGAALRNQLYDLVNGYVTAAKTVVVRPGTYRRALLSGSTVGLVAFGGKRHVFSHVVVSVPSGYALHVLAHPAGTDVANPIPIKTIHFVTPFMGYLYVVAEFDLTGVTTTLGATWHFWLQGGAVWAASKDYKIGDIVSPSTPNGLVYQARRLGNANPGWTAATLTSVGAVVEPTTPNGFYFTATETDGANPVTGATEPVWPTTSGATVFEDSEVGNNDVSAAAAPQPSLNTPASSTQTRYDNPYRGSTLITGG